jgi:hypothetical protein
MSGNNFFVVDDFLPLDQFITLRDTVMDEVFAWYYSECVSIDGVGSEDYYFVHTFFENEECYSSTLPVLNCVLNKLNVNKLLRVKANLYPNVNKRIDNGQHRDFNFPHKGAVFYVNTNNGATVLEDGTSIASVENRILLFDPSTLHNSTNSTDVKRRITINFNYL